MKARYQQIFASEYADFKRVADICGKKGEAFAEDDRKSEREVLVLEKVMVKDDVLLEAPFIDQKGRSYRQRL